MTVHVSRRYGFFASHRLHSSRLSDAENRAVFGKCNNPHGHGHNYEVEIMVRGQVDPITGRAVSLAALDGIAEEQILAPFRYRNLNAEIGVFGQIVPTTENLASEIEKRLRTAWPAHFSKSGAVLERISIWETERNICQVGIL